MKLLSHYVPIMGVVLMCLTVSANAVTPDPMNQNIYQREFKFLDINNDGKLVAMEAKKDTLFDATGFAKADVDKNGSLTQDEYATYKSAIQQKEAKQMASDSAITSQIKAKYLLEKGIKSFKISVETKDGIVVLSGFVDSAAVKARAEQIAATVAGVKLVNSALVVQP